VTLFCPGMNISHSVTSANGCSPQCDEGQCCSGRPGLGLSPDGTSCGLCPAGSYKNSTGPGQCTPCTEGTAAPQAGSFSCAVCTDAIPAGHMRNASGCSVPCPRGSYKSSIGPGICKLCNSSCICPPGKVPIADSTGCVDNSNGFDQNSLASEGCSFLASEGCSLCLPSCKCPLGRVATANGTGCLLPGITFVHANSSQDGLSCDAVCGATDGKGNGVASGEGVGCAKEGFLTDWSQDLLRTLETPAGKACSDSFGLFASVAPLMATTPSGFGPGSSLCLYPSNGGTSSTCAASLPPMDGSLTVRVCPCGPCPSGTFSPTGDRSPCQM
jgi:hypothetical protein